MMMTKEKRIISVSSSRVLWLVGLFVCSVLIALQIITLLPVSVISSSTLFGTPHPQYSTASLAQSLSSRAPPPEKPGGKMEEQIKRDPLPIPWVPPPESPAERQIHCDRTPLRYDLCKISGPTVVDPITATFFSMGPTRSAKPSMVERIQPYPRKFEAYIMAQIKNVTLISGPQGPPCKVNHNVPALAFSAGGYTGNFYHDFNDGFIPLFITVNTILKDEDFVIVVTDGPDWWSRRYADLLHVFSKHPIITLENESSTHCFPSAHLGLISHGFMIINQTLLPNSKNYLHFHDMLDQAYGHGHQNRNFMSRDPASRPRLVLASRSGSTGRVIINQKKLIQVMRQVGFDVVLFEPTASTSLNESYALISSSHVMVGVHGAALTHSLFLRPGTVFIQIVPIGVEWAADVFFGRVGRQMNLEYVEYKIGVGESSLVDKYGKDSLLLKNPFAFQKKGWPTEIMDIYLKKQNVRLDLVRFKKCLKEAYKKAKNFMRAQRGRRELGMIDIYEEATNQLRI